MRIALFTDADVFAGTEQHMLDLACGLREQGLEPVLLCPRPSPLADRAAAQRLPVIPIAKSGAIDVHAISALVRALNRQQIDIVHAHNGRTSILAAVAVTIARRGQLVTTQHFLSPARANRSGLKALISSGIHRWVGRRASRLIAVSQAAKAEMLARGDAPGDRITVIPNCVSQRPIPTRAEKIEARRALGINPQVLLILCAARLEPEKDVVSLVRAMSTVAARYPEILCIIAGEGSERSRIDSEIARLQLAKHVTLIGFCKQMSLMMTACDLLVLPSVAEPFGLVLLEAMAHARPVIATRAGGPPEIVEDGRTGLLVRPRHPQDLSNAIIQLVADAEMREKFGLYGWHRANECFSITRMSQAVADCYLAASSDKPALVPA